MNKTDLLVDILTAYTPLVLDKDFFYLEMPLDKSGIWFADRQIDNPRTGKRQYDIFYRGKTKASVKSNIAYFQDKIDNLTDCRIDGELFRLKLLYSFSYVGKDTEGYYVFTNTIELI